MPKPRVILAWSLALAAHAVLLVGVGSMTLAGGRPAKEGQQQAVTLNLAKKPSDSPVATAPEGACQPPRRPE